MRSRVAPTGGPTEKGSVFGTFFLKGPARGSRTHRSGTTAGTERRAPACMTILGLEPVAERYPTEDKLHPVMMEFRTWYDVISCGRRPARALLGKHAKAHEACQHLLRSRLRAERGLGDWLEQTVRHEGGRPQRNSQSDLTVSEVTKNQSSDWQRIAKLAGQNCQPRLTVKSPTA